MRAQAQTTVSISFTILDLTAHVHLFLFHIFHTDLSTHANAVATFSRLFQLDTKFYRNAPGESGSPMSSPFHSAKPTNATSFNQPLHSSSYLPSFPSTALV